MHATTTLPAALAQGSPPVADVSSHSSNSPSHAAAAPPISPTAASSLHAPRRPAEPLRGRDLALSLLGLLALGGAAALGTAGGSSALRLAPSVMLVDLAALAMTAPALIAIHQYMRLEASPEALAASLGRALVHGGRVAAGLAVVELFFAATTTLSIPLLVMSLLGVGVFSSATACVELTAAERDSSGAVAPRFSLLLVGWISLSWIIALRVGVDVSTWVLEGARGIGA